MRRMWTALVALSLIVGLLPAAALAQKTIKLHHINKDDPYDNPTGAMAMVFKALVESGTNRSLTVQTFPNGQLGKDNEVLSQVKDDVIQSGIFTVGGFAAMYPMISVLDVPFAFPNISSTYKVLDGPFGQKLSADIQKKTGFKVLGFGDSGGFFAITNSKKPIKTPDDLKGLKIRTMGLETHKRQMAAMGAMPVVIAWAEVYTSLQTGVADGQQNPIPVIAFGKIDEVQKYLTLSEHLFAAYVWVMNDKFYQGLTPMEKNVVNYAAKSAIVAGRGLARVIEASDRGLPALSKKLEVYALTPEEKAKFRDAAVPVVKQYLVENFGPEGEQMLGDFLKAVEEASKETSN
ncbi:MAG: DctP family TRAP transporter solute-binding subunit [Desulfovibrio sp.]|nr:DctP family TRAP transporter solute-binding subunit [Desulfovibrio sp.]MBI4958713.1 DctP family TRAP transporter solute-binding subunit [Desulfovibrio sp.]